MGRGWWHGWGIGWWHHGGMDVGAAVGDLVSSEGGLWFSAVTCTAAAVLAGWGAMMGLWQHRLPRMLVAAATTFIAVSYWVDLAEWSGAADMRRGAGWVLWPSLAWTAWTGVKYSRTVVRRMEETRTALDEERGRAE